MYVLTLTDDAEQTVFDAPAAESTHRTEKDAFDALENILTSAKAGDTYTMPKPGEVRIFDRDGHRVGTATVAAAA